jgi:predicted Fe-S protein YdhL (DUF1289 family)
MTKSNRGGYREGSGRKAEYDQPKQTKCLRFSAELIAWLDQIDNQSVEVERLLRASREFKNWAKGKR